MGRAFEFRKARKLKRWSTMAKTFTRIGKDISVSVKEDGPNPEYNSRLRAIIQNAKAANMPKDNINRAINKSEIDKEKNYESLRYEGFGPKNIALIIETLTENKNRTAGSIRTILQKHGGNLGSSGSTTHYFDNCGIIQFAKQNISDEEALELAINAGSNDCLTLENYHEIITKKDDFYKVKNTIIKSVKNLIYSGIEWRPNNFIDISKEESIDFENMLEQLHEDDDIQKVYHNCKSVQRL